MVVRFTKGTKPTKDDFSEEFQKLIAMGAEVNHEGNYFEVKIPDKDESRVTSFLTGRGFTKQTGGGGK